LNPAGNVPRLGPVAAGLGGGGGGEALACGFGASAGFVVGCTCDDRLASLASSSAIFASSSAVLDLVERVRLVFVSLDMFQMSAKLVYLHFDRF
jgi:hypothetical protein